jgi:hypothetical protein
MGAPRKAGFVSCQPFGFGSSGFHEVDGGFLLGRDNEEARR